ALVVLMAGPATNAATVGAIAREFGKRITGIYLAPMAGRRILFGWLFDLVAGQKFAPRQMVHTECHVTGILGGILLLGLFALFAGREIAARLRKQHEPTVSGDDVIVLRVGGMSCEGCMRNVRTALHAQRGVEHVDIDLASGKVMIRGHGFHELELREAVHEAGYTIESPE
ncbi:MAG: cation transporter, partial [Candidatus Pacebacteria bacterium]|nr:cation transporter [Candidatus Paceibacterota bacterium]